MTAAAVFVTAFAFAAAYWLLVSRFVRDGAKVRLTEDEMRRRRMRVAFAATTAAFGESLMPALRRATAALNELNRTVGKLNRTFWKR